MKMTRWALLFAALAVVAALTACAAAIKVVPDEEPAMNQEACVGNITCTDATEQAGGTPPAETQPEVGTAGAEAAPQPECVGNVCDEPGNDPTPPNYSPPTSTRSFSGPHGVVKIQYFPDTDGYRSCYDMSELSRPWPCGHDYPNSNQRLVVATVDWKGQDLTTGHDEVRFEFSASCKVHINNPNCVDGKTRWEAKDYTYDERDGLYAYSVQLPPLSPDETEKVTVTAQTWSWPPPVNDGVAVPAAGTAKTFTFSRTLHGYEYETCNGNSRPVSPASAPPC